jgi:hypothetical protein
MATLGQARLAKLTTLPSGSFVIDDVNEAMRYWYLSVVPTVILNALKAGTESDIYDLPGRNSFVVDSKTATIINVQGSLDGSTFLTICSTTAAATVQTFNVNTATAFRYYRLTAATNVTAHFSAVRS